MTHNMYRTPTHNSWRAMRDRVSNNHAHAKRFYAGVTCDPRWEKFENFLEDMGERPEGKTLDRIDSTKGYYKGNCRWATYTEQNRNFARNRIVEYKGVTYTLIELAELSSVAYGTLKRRLAMGWDVVLAVETPVMKLKRKVAT